MGMALPQFKLMWAMHVPSQVNLAVDKLSREGLQSHCPLFFSTGRDDPSLGIDAMAHRWPQGLLYASPFTLLQPLLHRVQVEEVSLILHQEYPWELPVQSPVPGHGVHFDLFPQELRLWYPQVYRYGSGLIMMQFETGAYILLHGP